MQAKAVARRARRNTVVFGAVFALASCGPAGPPRSAGVVEPPPVLAPEPIGTTVVLVTIDGARREEVFHGVDIVLGRASGLRPSELLDADALVPALKALTVEYGAAFGAPERGSEIRASGPNFVSLPGYTELLTGRGPSSCADNACGAITEPTLVDELTARFGCVAICAACCGRSTTGRSRATRNTTRRPRGGTSDALLSQPSRVSHAAKRRARS